MMKLFLTNPTMLQSLTPFNRLLSSAIATCIDGFFVIIPFNPLGGSKTPDPYLFTLMVRKFVYRLNL
jgi:hypothetical protein